MEIPLNGQTTVDGQGKSESPVDRWFMPLFTGFQHVSTILLVVQEFAGPSTVRTPKMAFLENAYAVPVQARSDVAWCGAC